MKNHTPTDVQKTCARYTEFYHDIKDSCSRFEDCANAASTDKISKIITIYSHVSADNIRCISVCKKCEFYKPFDVCFSSNSYVCTHNNLSVILDYHGVSVERIVHFCPYRLEHILSTNED